MDSQNVLASTEGAERQKKGYSTPELFDIGSATKLIQGPMINQPYRDCSNDGTSGWPQPCY